MRRLLLVASASTGACGLLTTTHQPPHRSLTNTVSQPLTLPRATSPLLLAKKKKNRTPSRGDDAGELPPRAAFSDVPLVLAELAEDVPAVPPSPPPPQAEDVIVVDEPKLNLPTFDDFARPSDASKPSPSGFQSKLPSINQGRSPYEGYEKEEKPLFERVITRITWGGIFVLVAIEIFINTPAFQQVKPAILTFLAAED